MTPEEYELKQREAGKRLIPESAKMCWTWSQVMDPYDLRHDLPPDLHCIGRLWFAQNPEGSAIWLNDLPDDTRRRLWERIEAGDFDEEPFFLDDLS